MNSVLIEMNYNVIFNIVDVAVKVCSMYVSSGRSG